MLSLYRQLLELRRREPAIQLGEWRDVGRDGSVLAYERAGGERRFMVAANLGRGPAALPEAARGHSGQALISTLTPRPTEWNCRRDLAAAEGVVVQLD